MKICLKIELSIECLKESLKIFLRRPGIATQPRLQIMDSPSEKFSACAPEKYSRFIICGEEFGFIILKAKLGKIPNTGVHNNYSYMYPTF